MGKQEDYEEKLEVIKAIEKKNIKTPHHLPPAVCVQEAVDLYFWAQADKEVLVGIGLDWEQVEDLQVRSNALSKAESIWQEQWVGRKSCSTAWNSVATQAYALRSRLLVDFRYAFRHHPDLMLPFKRKSKKNNHAKMIQDLSNLSALGKGNSPLLEAIGFDMSLLDKAAQFSSEMNRLLAKTIKSREELKVAGRIRNQAYTHLKEAVDQIRKAGQYAFRGDKERLQGYRSNHLRQAKLRQALNSRKKKATPPSKPPSTP